MRYIIVLLLLASCKPSRVMEKQNIDFERSTLQVGRVDFSRLTETQREATTDVQRDIVVETFDTLGRISQRVTIKEAQQAKATEMQQISTTEVQQGSTQTDTRAKVDTHTEAKRDSTADYILLILVIACIILVFRKLST